MNDHIQITTLDNGFRIISERIPALKSASLGIWVDAGARSERIEQNGIAHFLEHMAFKGTKTRSALQIAEEIENVGGYINAYTSREMTAYYIRCLEEHVALSVDVISDIVLNSIFDPRELEVERGVILQEIGQSLDTPDDVIFDWLQEAAYPNQPMGRTILGPAERVSSFTREDLETFVFEQYSPDQMVLSAAGAVDHKMLVEMAGERFSDLKKKPKLQIVGADFIGGEHREEKALEQAHFALSLEGPSYLNDAIYAAQTYAVALGGGMSSRLFQEIREKRGLCYSIYASMGAFADSGMMTIYSGTSGEQIKELTEVTLHELRRATEDISEVEVNRARAQMKSGLLMGLESASSRCERIARMLIIHGRVPSLDEVIAKVDAVDVAAVRDFAAQLIAQKPALALYGPVSQAPDFEKITKQLAA
ncbi:MAG: pitrilysin family protein [Pseudomonadota bacterium]